MSDLPPLPPSSVPAYGAPPVPPQNPFPGQPVANQALAPVGGKSYIVTWILSYLLGALGVDRFYLGKIGTGIVKLVSVGGFGIWWLIDLILVLTGNTRDSKGMRLAGYDEHKKISWIITGAIVLLGIIINAVTPKEAPAAQEPVALVHSAAASTEVPAAKETVDAEEVARQAEEAKAAEDARVAEEARIAEEARVAEEAKQAEEAKKAAEAAVPSEFRSALRKAESYSKLMHMSKAGLYDQLTSEYGEKFSAEAGQYAVDNIVADWNANALEKARSYRDMMDMSPSAIYDQLTSEYGEKFTPEQAQYAVDNLG